MLRVPLLALLAVSAMAAIPTHARAAPPPVAATSATPFVDSVGVNVHMGYSDTGYANVPGVVASLQRMGIRHVRDGVLAGRPDQHRAFAALGRAGIGLTLIMGDPARRSGPLAQLLPVGTSLRRSVDAVEGANEYDRSGPAWPPALRAHQRELFASVRGALGPATPVLAPSFSFGSSPDRLAAGGAVDADVANLHPYPGGQTPESVKLGEQVAQAQRVAPVETVQATETGYHDGERGSQPGISERAAEAYLPRLLLHNFQSGIARSFLYELLDQGGDEDPDQEAHFGLLRNDLSPKPSFYALKRLITYLDDGDGRRAGTLGIQITAGAAPVRQVLFRRCDGSSQMAVWRELPVHDPASRTEMAQPAVTATVELARAATAVSVLPTSVLDAPVRFPRRIRTFSFPLGPRVQVVNVPAQAGTVRRTRVRTTGGLDRVASALGRETRARGVGCLVAPRAGAFTLPGGARGRYVATISVGGRTVARGGGILRAGRPATIRIQPVAREARRLVPGARAQVSVRYRDRARGRVIKAASRRVTLGP